MTSRHLSSIVYNVCIVMVYYSTVASLAAIDAYYVLITKLKGFTL